MIGRRRKKKDPIDQLLKELVESPEELLRVTLFFVLIALLLAKLGQNEMMEPIREIFSVYLLFSDILLFVLLITAVAYIFDKYGSGKKQYRGI